MFPFIDDIVSPPVAVIEGKEMITIPAPPDAPATKFVPLAPSHPPPPPPPVPSVPATGENCRVVLFINVPPAPPPPNPPELRVIEPPVV
jgi:hypothetical protein